MRCRAASGLAEWQVVGRVDLSEGYGQKMGRGTFPGQPCRAEPRDGSLVLARSFALVSSVLKVAAWREVIDSPWASKGRDNMGSQRHHLSPRVSMAFSRPHECHSMGGSER